MLEKNKREIWEVFKSEYEEVFLYPVHGEKYDQYDEGGLSISKNLKLGAYVLRRHADGKYAAFNLNYTEMKHVEFRKLLFRNDLTEVFILKYPEVAKDFGMLEPDVLFMPN